MKTVVLCAQKMNYDGALDFSSLSEEVLVFPDDNREHLLESLEGAEVLITKENPVTAEMIQAFPDSLKLIVEAGTGYNNHDLEAIRKKGITLCNIPAYSTEGVAEVALMFLLMCSSSMGKQLRMIERKDFTNYVSFLSVPHHEVYRKTLGVIGEGRIGSRMIALGKALDMKILVYTRTPKGTEGVTYVSLEDLLKESDYVTLHTPLTEKTKHLIDKKKLSLMKETAYLINTSRGALINEEDLIEALREGLIAGAALDVQEKEPLSSESPLFTMDNVLLTPHIGWKGVETRKRLLSILQANIDAYREGHPINVVS